MKMEYDYELKNDGTKSKKDIVVATVILVIMFTVSMFFVIDYGIQVRNMGGGFNIFCATVTFISITLTTLFLAISTYCEIKRLVSVQYMFNKYTLIFIVITYSVTALNIIRVDGLWKLLESIF